MLQIDLGRTVCSFVFIVGVASAARAAPPCKIDIPAFTALGNVTAITVVAVKPEDRDINLLNVQDVNSRVFSKGAQLQFPRSLIGRQVSVYLRDSKGPAVSRHRVFLMSCIQRQSLQVGARQEQGGDVSVSTASGRITGCRINGNWWVRMMPMFGSLEHGLNHEGTIDSNGAVVIVSSFTGERHLLVIGKDRDPIKAFGVNLIVGGTNALGDIDLSSACPK